MARGRIILVEDLNEPKYQIPEESLLWRISNGELEGLEKESFERREGAKLFAIEREILSYNQEKPIPRIITCHKPGDANVYEIGEDLKWDSNENIEDRKVGFSKFLFVAVGYYKIEQKALNELKKRKNKREKSNLD